MKQLYESEVLFQLMERDGFNIPSSVPPYESEIKAYLINQVKQAYPKLTDYEAEWLLYNYTKHLPAEFPISTVENTAYAHFENVVPFAYQSAILKGSTKYRDIDTGEFLETFEEGRNLELLSVKMPVLKTLGKNLVDNSKNRLGNIDANTGAFYSSKNAIVTEPIRVYHNEYIGSRVVSNESQKVFSAVSYRIYDLNMNYLGNLLSTLPSDGGYVVLRCLSNNGDTLDVEDLNFVSFQLEEGSVATSYEPYQSNILSTSEEVVLRGIGDVKDTLDCLTGEVVQNIGEIVLDGSEEWKVSGYNNWTNCYTEKYVLPHLINKGTSLISDKMISYINYDYLGAKDVIGVAITKEGCVCLKYLPNGAKPKPSEVSAYLESNPITFQYPLENESIKTVDLTTLNESGETVYFMPLEGIMNVSTSSETIQPTFDMTVPVEATTQNLASFINMETEE